MQTAGEHDPGTEHLQVHGMERPTPSSEPKTADPWLSISVFARRSRLSMKALRLYDRLGLLRPARVEPDTGYRRYRESQLPTARLVAMLRRLDMPLEQVAAIVAAPRPQSAELLAAYWDAVERKIAFQREIAAHIRSTLLDDNEGRFAMYEIREREVPEQVVLTEQRHVSVEELPVWLGEAMPRLGQAALNQGIMAGPMFVVYHGEVNEDSDGPVEVCVPIASAAGAPAGTATRHEPAHREAYARLTQAQVAFPQILSAYDAVAHWISANGRDAAGPPREVYFADWSAIGPADEACDVAFPIR